MTTLKSPAIHLSRWTGRHSRRGGRKAGVRYADYALGRFMEAARQHAWFDNTLFVIVADHDASRVYGRAQVPH
ncbi:MAG: sulfatase-like hydrolase/transferase [Syntrophotaleaceae bacterium]